MNNNELWSDTNIPPGVILMTTSVIDSLTTLFFGKDFEWRNYVPIESWVTHPHGWLSYRVPYISETFPTLLTYQSFLDDNNTTHSLSNMYQFAFKTPNTTLGNLTTPQSLLVLLLLTTILRLLKTNVIIPPLTRLGTTFATQTHGKEWIECNPDRIIKFGEYGYRLGYHFGISVLGYYLFRNQIWWDLGSDDERRGIIAIFLGHPHHEIRGGMIWYYMIQAAYNLDALWSLLVISFVCEIRSPFPFNNNKKFHNIQSPVYIGYSPTIRGDFREMFIHHVVTNTLIFGSSYFRFTRVGSMVFMIHDVSDVPIDISKLANFLKWKYCTVLAFVLTLVAWVGCRLIFFPFVLFRSCLFESEVLVYECGMDPIFYRAYHLFFKGGLAGLILLHVVWFVILVRIGLVLVMKGETHDLSEHKAGEVVNVVEEVEKEKKSEEDVVLAKKQKQKQKQKE